MIENTVDLAGYDILWQNIPELPVASEENKKLEESLKSKKLETEKLKILLESNIIKGKNMREHINDLTQSLSYKQQLYKTREHELEMEIHDEKVMEREYSRLEQEMRSLITEIKNLKYRQQKREEAVSEQKTKRDTIKSTIQWDEEALLQYLAKSAEMEKDNMALLKYTSEDNSKINELDLLVERLSKEVYDKRSALEDANTEVLIVQSELDRIQEEFRNAYTERSNLIGNWEKVINQIQHRNNEINKLSEYINKLKDDQVNLRRALREQKELLFIESSRNDGIERTITEKDNLATRLRNEYKVVSQEGENLKAELSTIRNVLNNILYQKQSTENNIRQLEQQLNNRSEKIARLKNANKEIEVEIEKLNKETFDAEHYTKELDAILTREKTKNQNLEKEIESICKDILTFGQEMNQLKAKEKFIDSQIKNKQTEIQNLKSKLIELDQVKTKQESDMYTIESTLEKIDQRVKKMAGERNEEERRKVEAHRSSLLATLEEKNKSLNMLNDELKIMEEKMTLSSKELVCNKKKNLELLEKIKFLEFYISNSQKSLKCCISRKQEILVQECLEKFQMKRYQKLLNNKNKSVASLQKNKLEFETSMKERIEELKHCNELVDAEIRAEEEESSNIKRKYKESVDKVTKLQSKYEIILDSLGVSEPGENAEAEMLINAENEKRDLQSKRDNLLSRLLKSKEELSALRNTLWIINVANEQFREVVYPPGISVEDSKLLRDTEVESQDLAIQIHVKKTECKVLEESLTSLKERMVQEQKKYQNLQNVVKDREFSSEVLYKEISDHNTKIQRAERCNSRLTLDIKNKSSQIGIEEDIRIHLLREIRRTVSDILFSTVEHMPHIMSKIQQLYEQANLPLPSRAQMSFSRSGSSLSFSSRSNASSIANSRRPSIALSVVTLGSSDNENG